jgi:hypothetical protein
MPGKSAMPTLQSPQALRWKQPGQLAERRAGRAASEIHAFKKAEEIARRIKDGAAFEKALIGKLESQRDFATQYRALFPWGVNVDRRGGGGQRARHLRTGQFCPLRR